VKCILEKIDHNFARYSKGNADYDPDLWTHEAMQSSEFWREQRSLAKQALDAMQK